MDDFAQSREPDDLFSDEIELTEQQVTQNKRNVAPTKSHPHPRHGAPNSNHSNRSGRRGAQNGGTTSARAEQPIPTAPSPTAPTESNDTSTTTENNPTPLKASTAPGPTNSSEEPRIASVRGDRSATGPAKPTKKTEAELTELMKSMQLKNAAKTEAHARAEKDQASFLQREQQAAAKRVEERKAIREQDMERAKNRERKIRAQGGREWDSEKVEEAAAVGDRGRGGGGSSYSRGMHGGVRGGGRGGERGGGLASSRYGGAEDADDMVYGSGGGGGGGGGGGARGGRGRGRGRGRGDFDSTRGGGGRGGRGRGGHFNGANAVDAPASSAPLHLSGDSDFPALPPPSSKSNATLASKAETKEKPAASSGVTDGDWADEMATPTEKT